MAWFDGTLDECMDEIQKKYPREITETLRLSEDGKKLVIINNFEEGSLYYKLSDPKAELDELPIDAARDYVFYHVIAGCDAVTARKAIEEFCAQWDKQNEECITLVRQDKTRLFSYANGYICTDKICFQDDMRDGPTLIIPLKRYFCKCPVCGKRTLMYRGMFYICDECGWEDGTGSDEVLDAYLVGDPSPYTGNEYRRKYLRIKRIDPTYTYRDPIRFWIRSCKIEELTETTFSKTKIDKFVQFGHYPQTKEGGDSTPIEWKVLAMEGTKTLLISRYGLDVKRYSEEFDNEEWIYKECEDFTWETSTPRKWLNNDFLNAAFSTSEQAMIQNTNVTANKNPYHNTNPGNATTDKLFLLSITEVEKYFTLDEDRMCAPTDYVLGEAAERDYQITGHRLLRDSGYEWGADTNKDYKVDGKDTCWWWLRSPGCAGITAAFVDHDGSVYHYGNLVGGDGGCVRPALWVDLEP